MNNAIIGSKNTDSRRNTALSCFFKKAPSFFVFLYFVYIFGSLFQNVIYDKRLKASIAENFCSVPAPLILFLALLLSAGLLVGCISVKRKSVLSDKRFCLAVTGFFALAFLAQLFVSKHIVFYSGWDVEVIRDAAIKIAQSKLSDGVQYSDFCISYFSMYPNNLTLVHLLAALYRLGELVYPIHPYAIIVVFTNFSVCLSVYLMVLCIFKTTQSKKVTVAGMLISGILIVFSPWITVPYSDSLGMIFPIAAIFCVLFIKKAPLKNFLVAMISVFGYHIKPTALIVLIAYIMIGICDKAAEYISGFTLEKLKKDALSFAGLVCGIVAAAAICSAIVAPSMQVINTKYAYGPAHFWMMGHNTETEGFWSQDDVTFTNQFSDPVERRQANIDEGIRRLQSMGLNGYLRLLAKKNISNYNNGTFSWAAEYNYRIYTPEDNSLAASVLRDYFYVEGKNSPIFAAVNQTIWYSVLIFISIGSFFGVGIRSEAEKLSSISLLGLSIFLLMFECRSRYMFLYSPVFVLLACMELERLCKRLKH